MKGKSVAAWLALLMGIACSGPATGPCAQTIDAYCSAAGDAACTFPGDQRICPDNLISASCGSYDAVILQGVDSSLTRYYDRGTGRLLAVVSWVAAMGSRSCVAGPADGFNEPGCPRSEFTEQCPDGGI